MYMYWGEHCDERANLLKQFFFDNYNYEIFYIPRNCACEEELELIPINEEKESATKMPAGFTQAKLEK